MVERTNIGASVACTWFFILPGYISWWTRVLLFGPRRWSQKVSQTRALAEGDSMWTRA